MICQNCGKELEENEQYCSECGEEQKISECKKTVVKDFILKGGRFLTDFNTYIAIGIIALLAIAGLIISFVCLIPNKAGFFENSNLAPICYVLSLVIPTILLIVHISFKYLIYLLIDIRDNLDKIANGQMEGK